MVNRLDPVRRSLPALALGIVLIWAGCGDDPTQPPTRSGRTFVIPFDGTLEERANTAIPGDTLILAVPSVLSGTIEIESDQTPLVIEGNKTVTVSSLGSGPLIRFVQPRPGTRVSSVVFLGGEPALLLSGVGAIEITDCRFQGGGIQVLAAGSGLTVTASGNLMRDAGLFSFQITGGARLVATGNTIAGAGDCGILLSGGTQARVSNCIIWDSLNYGIACQGGTLESESTCNNIFASGQAPYLGCTPPEGDLALDPLFCDPDGNDYSIATISPCAPDNSGGCGLIGALDPTCVTPGSAAAQPSGR